MATTICYGQANQKIGLANAYYQEGEFEKAISIYRELTDSPQNISFIHNNYLEILYAKQYNDEAEKYLKTINKIFPSNINYQVDFVDFYITINDSSKAEKVYRQIESNV